MRVSFRRRALLAGVCVLTACGDADNVDRISALATSECGAVREGQHYIVQGGLFVPAAPPEAEIIEKVIEAPRRWDQLLEDSFAELGFPWLGLNVRDGVATLTGLSPSLEEKERAFEAGEQAILADAAGAAQVSLIVDGISVEGGEEGVGTALAALEERPSLAACQAAFTRTMDGRYVVFETASDVISGVSARLLDAVTGVAILCKDYNVEIGGHTDARGSEELNLELSTRRAMAVRGYLLDKGVPAEGLTAVGYGEGRPLATGSSADAYARNRRTEFTVSER